VFGGHGAIVDTRKSALVRDLPLPFVQDQADGATSATRLSPAAAYGRLLLLDAAPLK
jgi:hypothetical protein